MTWFELDEWSDRTSSVGQVSGKRHQCWMLEFSCKRVRKIDMRARYRNCGSSQFRTVLVFGILCCYRNIQAMRRIHEPGRHSAVMPATTPSGVEPTASAII